MGNVIQLLSYIKTTDKAMYEDNLRIEVSEAIHVHHRDVRILMTPEQFMTFFQGVYNSYKNKNFDGELSSSDIMLDSSLIPGPELFEGEWKIEKVEGGTIHFHYGDLRIEMTPKRFNMLAGLFQTALEVYDGKQKNTII